MLVLHRRLVAIGLAAMAASGCSLGFRPDLAFLGTPREQSPAQGLDSESENSGPLPEESLDGRWYYLGQRDVWLDLWSKSKQRGEVFGHPSAEAARATVLGTVSGRAVVLNLKGESDQSTLELALDLEQDGKTLTGTIRDACGLWPPMPVSLTRDYSQETRRRIGSGLVFRGPYNVQGLRERFLVWDTGGRMTVSYVPEPCDDPVATGSAVIAGDALSSELFAAGSQTPRMRVTLKRGEGGLEAEIEDMIGQGRRTARLVPAGARYLPDDLTCAGPPSAQQPPIPFGRGEPDPTPIPVPVANRSPLPLLITETQARQFVSKWSPELYEIDFVKQTTLAGYNGGDVPDYIRNNGGFGYPPEEADDPIWVVSIRSIPGKGATFCRLTQLYSGTTGRALGGSSKSAP